MQLFTNNATSTLAAGISSAATAISLASGTGSKFPALSGGDYFLLTLFQMSGSNEVNHEIVKITARSADTLTAVRGYENTTARAFNIGDPVSMRLTAGSMHSDAIVEGTTNQFFTLARVQAALLTGITFTVNAAISATDNFLVAFGKLQKQITDLIAAVDLKANANNPTFTGNVTFPSQTAKYFFAAPNGANGAPTFRLLVASDIPALSYAPVSGSANYLAPAAIGSTVQPYSATLVSWAGKAVPTGAVLGTTDTQTLTNKTFTGYKETVYPLAGTDISAANGSIQTKTLSGITTFTESMADGESVVLMLNPSTFAVTWPAISWVNSAGTATAPTLKASVTNVIVVWQVAGVLYGNWIGSM